MRIVIISTPIGFLGSGLGGGVELTLNSLVSGISEKGHNAVVIAPKGSYLNIENEAVELVSVEGIEQQSWQHQDYFAPVTTNKGSIINNMVEKAISYSSDCDAIVNLSYDYLPILETLNAEIPIAHLISMGNESFAISNIIEKVYKKYPNNFAFHSQVQASDYPFILNPNIVGNGFQLSNYEFQSCKNGPLGWVGRVAPEKGLEDAVFVADKLQEKLNIWGIIQDRDYAISIEKAFPKGLISWNGFLKTFDLQKALGRCRALINTPKWNEAYGNVVVESMACGVPVVSYRLGGPSEIIQHGETGYLVDPNDKKGLIECLKIINSIDRKKCRDWVEKNASSSRFAGKVITWLQNVIKDSKQNA